MTGMYRRAFACFLALGPAFPALALVVFEKSELTIETAAARHKFTIEVARTAEQLQQGLM